MLCSRCMHELVNTCIYTFVSVCASACAHATCSYYSVKFPAFSFIYFWFTIANFNRLADLSSSVGESQRPIRTRLQEHHADARKRTKNTPWGDHMKHCHPDTPVDKTPFFRATILAIELRVTRRKIREAIEIRDRKPQINKTKGWKLD